MLSYEFGYWWADFVVKLQQTLPQQVGEQVFVSELTHNSYFLCHWGGVNCGGDEARGARGSS